MDTRATRRGVPAVVIWGGFGALAWAALTVVIGGGSAHADEQPDGPLDGLTSVVSETVTAVTAPVTTQVVAPVVTQVVTPVVKAVVAPVQQAAPAVVKTVSDTVAQVPVVGTAAAPVVQVVTDTAQAVVTPVTDTLTESPVAQITDPILDAVSGLPIVGGIATDTGAIDLIDDVVGIVDGATGLVGEVAEETIPPILEALDPTVPPGTEPGSPGLPGIGSAVQLLGATASVVHSATPALASLQPVAPATTSTVVIGERGAWDSISDSPTGGAPPGAPVAPSSSAGPGGGSSSAHARLSDVGVPPLRAWERTSGATDDALPASPVAATDVSPD